MQSPASAAAAAAALYVQQLQAATSPTSSTPLDCYGMNAASAGSQQHHLNSLTNLMAYQQQQLAAAAAAAVAANQNPSAALAGLRAFPTLLSVPPVVLVSNLNEEVGRVCGVGVRQCVMLRLSLIYAILFGEDEMRQAWAALSLANYSACTR